MKTRNTYLLGLRDEIPGVKTNATSEEEMFQNNVIRPILKFQNDLFVHAFINYAMKQKSVFFNLTPEKKMGYIENVIQRDIKFRNSLKGMIIALFTTSEYDEYIKNSSNLNKRMMNILIEMLKNQLQLIVEHA